MTIHTSCTSRPPTTSELPRKCGRNVVHGWSTRTIIDLIQRVADSRPDEALTCEPGRAVRQHHVPGKHNDLHLMHWNPVMSIKLSEALSTPEVCTTTRTTARKSPPGAHRRVTQSVLICSQNGGQPTRPCDQGVAPCGSCQATPT